MKKQKATKIGLSLLVAVVATFFMFSINNPAGTAEQTIEYEEVVVAQTDIPEFSQLSEKVEVKEVPKEAVPKNTLTSLPEGEQTALLNINEGQFIFSDMFKANSDLRGKEMRTFAVPISIETAGVISPNDRVDIIYLDEYQESRVILSNVLVESLLDGEGNKVTVNNDGEAEQYPRVAELSVSIQDAETLHTANFQGRTGIAKYYPESQSLHESIEEENEEYENLSETEGE